MGVLECCRIVLYLVEWIWTTVVLGIFPNKLSIEVALVENETQKACLFNTNVGGSRCDFGVSNLPTTNGTFLTLLYRLYGRSLRSSSLRAPSSGMLWSTAQRYNFQEMLKLSSLAG